YFCDRPLSTCDAARIPGPIGLAYCLPVRATIRTSNAADQLMVQLPFSPQLPPLVLISEDDLDDRFLLQEALRENGIASSNVSFVGDGDELLERLAGIGRRPAIVLLDLNMPRKDGREALREIKSNKSYSHIPVLILTTSNSEDDIRSSYRNGGNTFFVKPPVFQELVEVVRVIKQYWLELAALAT